MNNLQIGLPVMLHREDEILAFLKAKERIELLGGNLGFPLSVGAFLFFTPRALSDENRKEQIKNQKKYRLQIIHAQTPIKGEHSLSYSSREESFFRKKGLLETAIEQCAELKSFDHSDYALKVDVHVGIVLTEDTQRENPFPGIYSLDYFLQSQKNLLERSTARFSELNALAGRYGFEMVLENAFAVAMNPDEHDPSRKPKFHYYPFNDFANLKEISGGSMTFDSGHWAAARDTFTKFKAHQTSSSFLFKMEGIDSWEEYLARNPDFESYFPFAKALHLSNVTGICGVPLAQYPEVTSRWGEGGTIEGVLSSGEMKKMLVYARDRGLPVILEVDYDIKNIPRNEFSEADAMLKYVL